MSLPFESEYNTEVVVKPLKRVAWNKGLKGTHIISPEHKEKLRKANQGRKMSEQNKAALRKVHVGRVPTEATKQKLREANLGKTLPPEQVEAWVKTMKAGNKYKKTPEHKAKLSKAQKAHKASVKKRLTRETSCHIM